MEPAVDCNGAKMEGAGHVAIVVVGWKLNDFPFFLIVYDTTIRATTFLSNKVMWQEGMVIARRASFY